MNQIAGAIPKKVLLPQFKKNIEKGDEKMRKAYKIVGSREVYRTFPTYEEAESYREIVWRGAAVKIVEIDQYPNSRFINNRPLTIRGSYA